MFRFLAIFALGLFLSGTVNSQQATELETRGLKGRVHSVSSEASSSLSFEGFEHQEASRTVERITFKPNGQLLKYVLYNDQGEISITGENTRDVAGRLITDESHDPKGRLRSRMTYTYRDGRLEEITSYHIKGMMDYPNQRYSYDQQGTLKDETYFYKGQLIGRTSFKLDDNKKMTEAAYFLPDGSKGFASVGPCFRSHRVTYNYDSRGRVADVTAFEVNGSVKRKSSYLYDDQGNIAEEFETVRHSTHKSVHSYVYDSVGNWTTHITLKRTIRESLSSAAPILFPDARDLPSESESRTIETRTFTYY